MHFWRANVCSLLLCGAAALTVVALPTTTHAQLPASINLANDLDGTNGFRQFTGGNFVTSVSDAGDVNGDGIDDLFIADGEEAHVVFGNAGGFSQFMGDTTLDGTNGFSISGGRVLSVSGAGDINGDGIDDLVFGATGETGFFGVEPNNNSINYVVFGDTAGFNATFDVGTLDGTNGFTINGGSVGNPFPDVLAGSNTRRNSSVSSAGDINGDGFDDLIIGDRFANQTGVSGSGDTLSTGASFVVFGDAGGFSATVDLTTLGGTDGVVFNGPHDSAATGQSVSSAGDFNGDGIDDVVIGTPGSNESYVVFGDINGFNSPLDPSMLDGTNGFVIQGSTTGNFTLGSTVSGAGDVNGDGLDDLIIGDFDFLTSVNGGTEAGYVVFGTGNGFGGAFNVDTLDGTNGFQIQNLVSSVTGLGRSVSGAGDVNGDGFDDIIIGDDFGDAFVIYGDASGFNSIIDVSSLDGTNGFTLSSLDHTSVSGAGDINGDGIDDLIIGGGVLGESYVVFGAIPEPSSMWLVFGGMLGCMGSRRRAN